MKTKGYIGRPMKRIEDPRLIKGIASYVDDLALPGMLHAAFLRSPYAHAKITSFKTESAKAAPGVVGVFTGADVNAHCGVVPCATAMPDMKAPKHTVLAGERVYFVGHPVAGVVAKNRYAARDALDLIEVDYDPLPAESAAEQRLGQDPALTPPHLGRHHAYPP